MDQEMTEEELLEIMMGGPPVPAAPPPQQQRQQQRQQQPKQQQQPNKKQGNGGNVINMQNRRPMAYPMGRASGNALGFMSNVDTLSLWRGLGTLAVGLFISGIMLLIWWAGINFSVSYMTNNWHLWVQLYWIGAIGCSVVELFGKDYARYDTRILVLFVLCFLFDICTTYMGIWQGMSNFEVPLAVGFRLPKQSDGAWINILALVVSGVIALVPEMFLRTGFHYIKGGFLSIKAVIGL